MPNPSIAIAGGSYAGRTNIQDSFTSSGRLSSWLGCPTHEMQRPKICERFGSATRLKVGSHPIGGRDSIVTTGGGTLEVRLGTSGKRSPLWVRSTETISDCYGVRWYVFQCWSLGGPARAHQSRRIAERELSEEAGMGSWESAYNTLMPNAADIAQLGEISSIISLQQVTLNQRVQGSRP